MTAAKWEGAIVASKEPDLLPELYFATVRAMGAEIDTATRVLCANLGHAGYETETVRLSSLFKDVPLIQEFLDNDTALSEYELRNNLMNAGDALRTLVDTAAVAKLGLDAIQKMRTGLHRRAHAQGRRGVAYVIRSLMHESEVSFLRAVLGSRLFVVSFFSAEDVRRNNLVLSLRARPGSEEPTGDTIERWADDLLLRDQGREFLYEHPLAHKSKTIQKLSLEKTFHEADFFVDVDKPKAAERQITRFVQLIFGDPYGTTTEDEAAMAHAFTALRESSVVARRVGAAVVVGGILVTVGRNDLPQAGGGQLRQPTEGRMSDELSAEPEASTQERKDVLCDVLRRLLSSEEWLGLLQDKGFEVGSLSREDLEEVLRETAKIDAVLQSRIFDLIEFNPTVHAEMSAITAATRMGTSLQDAVLYTTTFPCHECTRHIVSTGIERVVYLEPYPKSRAEALFSSQIHLGERGDQDTYGTDIKVTYQPFMGVAPRRQGDLFSWVRRGKSIEEIRSWSLSPKRDLRPSIEPVVPESLRKARDRFRREEISLAVKDFWQAIGAIADDG